MFFTLCLLYAPAKKLFFTVSFLVQLHSFSYVLIYDPFEVKKKKVRGVKEEPHFCS